MGTKGLTKRDLLGEIDRRIWQLRRQHVPATTQPENLDQPMDPAVRVQQQGQRYRFELMLDGRAASWLNVVDFRQQIGSATWRVGGIAGVGTDVDFRFQGLSRRTMIASLRWMRQNGFQCSLLFGIPSFYPKFGYATAFPKTSFHLALRDAERVGPCGVQVAEFDAARHLPAVLRLYEHSNAGITGPVRRVAGQWEPFRKGATFSTRALVRVLLDGKGRCVGYLAFDHVPDAATVIEAGLANEKHLPDLVAAAAAYAAELRVGSIEFKLPRDHALTRFCQPLGISQQIVHRRDGGAMVRLINVRGALEILCDDFARRLYGAGIGPGALMLKTNLEPATLRWDGKQVTVTAAEGQAAKTSGASVRLPQWALAQLMLGLRDVGAMLADGTVTAPRGVELMLAAMFPTSGHFIYAVDEF